jgi:hypothetical protein
MDVEMAVFPDFYLRKARRSSTKDSTHFNSFAFIIITSHNIPFFRPVRSFYRTSSILFIRDFVIHTATMHSNIFALAFCVLAIPTSVIARPNANALSERSIEPLGRVAHPIALRRRSQRAQLQQANQETAQAGQEAAVGGKQKEAAAGKEKEAAAGGKEGAAGGEAAGGEEEAKESMCLSPTISCSKTAINTLADEVEIESAFDAAVPVQGGDLKQDLVFTPSTVGKFEFEFQSAAADEITVTENAGAAAAAPPAGFEAIEPNSYTVALGVSKGAGLTLSKIDYIFDAAAAGLAGKDVTQAQVGKLCAETGSFVISELLGELEFEVEENEVTLNLNKNVTAEGQWGESMSRHTKYLHVLTT